MNARAHSANPRLMAIAFLGACALALSLTSTAQAAPPQLWQSCDSDEPAGQQCERPRGIAADPDNGHVFVADSGGDRIVEFNALGEFVKAWGWDVAASGPGDDTVAPEDEFEVCVPEDGDTCKAGTNGAGAGQTNEPQGLAIDSGGDVFVTEIGCCDGLHRVQKFSPDGQFLLMFGGEVNKTKVQEREEQEENLEPISITEAEENLCTGASGDECGAGTEGTGQGQFGALVTVGDYVAIDDEGTATATDDKVWVGDENRIQRFDTDGIYQGEVPVPGEVVQLLDTDSSGNLYTAYSACPGGGCAVTKPEIHKLSPTGEPLAPTFEIPQQGGFEPARPSALAVSAAGHLFAFGPVCSPCPGTPVPVDPIFEFDPAGNVVSQFGKDEFGASTGLATNLCAGSQAPGNLYVTDLQRSFVRAYGTFPIGCFKALTGEATNIEETGATLNGTVNPGGAPVGECSFEYGTTTAYGTTIPCAETPAQIGEGADPVPVHADISGLQKATTYHFRLLARIDGTTEKGPDKSFKTLGPPIIADAFTLGATYTEASVKALINPEGFSTTYRVEYGPDSGYGQSTAEFPLASDRTEHAAIATLTGLEPGTTYHWRIVATNSSGADASEDHTLTTYRPFAPQTDCPNQVHRIGASAPLPDCRAYEMVSPLDKNGGDIVNGLSAEADPGGNIRVATDGERITYTAPASFGDQPSAPNWNQYIATREAGKGWSSHGINQPMFSESTGEIQSGYFREFIAFTPDLCSAWLIDYQTPPLTAEAQEGYRNLYRRDNCEPGEGGFEALVPAVPDTTTNPYVNQSSVQGVSDDGRHAIFVARAKLSDDANEGGNAQIYDRFEGEVSLVSVRPSGEAETAISEVGSGWSVGGNLHNAVSQDGTVYWTAGGSKLFVRTHPEQGVVDGECSEPAKACTRQVSGASNFPAFFWAAAADGSKALYSQFNLQAGGETLVEYDLTKAEGGQSPRRVVASRVRGVVGASEDLKQIYFVSNDLLPDSGQNSEGDAAQEAKPNLYLAEGDAVEFIGTLVEGDVGALDQGMVRHAYNLIGRSTYTRAARVSAGGAQLAFESRASLTGFDNRDAGSGEASVEVFRYEAGGKLNCVSCNPSGARPKGEGIGRPYIQPFLGEENPERAVRAAAWIPTWEHPLYASNVLSADGSRLFFNSFDPLLPRDTNGARDVYEWEAPGTGSCMQASPSYFSQNGGCLYLISSGENSSQSEFWEASADGDDVFFTTQSSLVAQDPGLIDLYDARVEGGFPPPTRVNECEGEACQSPPAPPDDPTPASSAFQGAGNVKQPPASCKPQAKRAKRAARQAKRLRRAANRANSPARSRALRKRTKGAAKRAKRLSQRAKRCRQQRKAGRNPRASR